MKFQRVDTVNAALQANSVSVRYVPKYVTKEMDGKIFEIKANSFRRLFMTKTHINTTTRIDPNLKFKA